MLGLGGLTLMVKVVSYMFHQSYLTGAPDD